MNKKFAGFVAGASGLLMAGAAQAAITVPTLATTDIETGATAILALVAVFVTAGMVIKMLKRG